MYLLECDGFNPDASPKELAEYECCSQEREGYFHRWMDDNETGKDIPYVKTVALVEDAESGKMNIVEYYNLRFVKD